MKLISLNNNMPLSTHTLYIYGNVFKFEGVLMELNKNQRILNPGTPHQGYFQYGLQTNFRLLVSSCVTLVLHCGDKKIGFYYVCFRLIYVYLISALQTLAAVCTVDNENKIILLEMVCIILNLIYFELRYQYNSSATQLHSILDKIKTNYKRNPSNNHYLLPILKRKLVSSACI